MHPSIRLVPSPLPIDPPDLRAPDAAEPDGELLHAEAARDRSWWLGGRRVHADFHGLRGLSGARFGLRARLTDLSWGEGASAATWISPRAVRLERTSPAGSFLETIWVPERLPGLLVELRPVGGWIRGRTLRGTLRLDFGDVDPRQGAGQRQHDVPESPDLHVAVGGDGATRWCGLDPSDGLLIAAFDRDGAVDVLGEPRVESGSLVIDVAWTPAAGEPPAGDRTARGVTDSPLALAILAGEPSPASLRSLLVAKAHARRAAPTDEALRTSVGLDEVDTAVAWAWTRMRDRVLDDVGPIPALAPDELAPWVRTALAVGLPDAARAVLPTDPRTPRDADAWAAWAAGVGDDTPIDDLEPRVDDARIGSGGPEAWRARIASDPVALAPDGWRILEGLVSSVLGWRPDAATGRMHLTPRLPSNWTRFGVRGLCGGELRMRLEWRRTGTSEVWTFAPMAGAVPATLILRLPLPEMTTPVTVDGVSAELDPERIDGETRVPIQLQLDRERVVRVEGASGRGGGGSRIVLPTLSPSSR